MMQIKGFQRLFVSVFFLALGDAVSNLNAQNYIVRSGDYWTYWDLGFEPDPDWTSTYYDDSLWGLGPSPLGYGEPYIATDLYPAGMTAYFRTYFLFERLPTFTPVRVRVRRDDGVIIYLNGIEMFRNNMPDGEVDDTTAALSSVEADSFVEFTIDDVFYFENGYNVIAAEVHQQSGFSDDLVFDLELIDDSGGTGRHVEITSPADNTSVAIGSDVTITANAGPAAEVTGVNFYSGTTLLATDTNAPYQTVLYSVQPSNYVVRAVAMFNDSTSLTSAPVRFTAAAAQVIRGPYLQLGTPTSIIVKWRTDAASDSVVRYGLSPLSLNQSASAPAVTVNHEVQLSGLTPDTRYYYSIGSSTATLAGTDDYYFVTTPLGPKPTRIWVTGDAGGAGRIPPDLGLHRLRDAYYNYDPASYTDLWLMRGDNAYDLGADDEYQRGMFNVYPDLLRKTVVWPTIGNHEYYTDVYLNIFSLPKNGEAGGVASGVENYYSFNYGDIHFVCLAGYYSGSLSSNGPMCNWLKADLEANTNKWLIAFWHQPPYTKGSHDSDSFQETSMTEMRTNAVPILESYGVDLVLSGHSHVYERSYLLRGHYGYSWDFAPEMMLDSGSGRVDDTGPYVKQTSGANADQGTVYVVNGSSGWTLGCCYGVHPAMYRSLRQIGSLILDIEGDALQGTFLRGDGVVDDYFTIRKDGAVVQIVNISVDDGTTTLSWTSKPGRHYRVEFTGNLAVGWTPVGDLIEANGTLTTTGHVTGGAVQGFYRVLQTD